jgi:hypothetical protein
MVTSWSRRCRPISTRLDEWHVGHVIVNPLFLKKSLPRQKRYRPIRAAA